MGVEEMTLKLILCQTLLTHRAEVVSLVCLPDEEIGVGLEVVRPARGGWVDHRHSARLHCDPRHLWKYFGVRERERDQAGRCVCCELSCVV